MSAKFSYHLLLLLALCAVVACPGFYCTAFAAAAPAIEEYDPHANPKNTITAPFGSKKGYVAPLDDERGILHVDSHTISYKNDMCVVLANYPHFGNSKADADLEFWVKKSVHTFITGIEALASPGEERYSLAIDYDVSDASPLYVSIVFRISADLGAERSAPGMVTFTYDLTDGRRLEFEDIFDDTAGLVYFMSLYVREELTARLGAEYAESIARGTSPDLLNFSFFALEPFGVKVFFPPYQVADGSLGEQSVMLPLEKLKAYKPKMKVWGEDVEPFRLVY